MPQQAPNPVAIDVPLFNRAEATSLLASLALPAPAPPPPPRRQNCACSSAAVDQGEVEAAERGFRSTESLARLTSAVKPRLTLDSSGQRSAGYRQVRLSCAVGGAKHCPVTERRLVPMRPTDPSRRDAGCRITWGLRG